MATNTAPRYTKVARLASVTVTAANTASDGSGTIGTNIFLLLTAGSNDTYIERIVWLPTSTTAAPAMAGTTARHFRSTQSSGSVTSANTSMFAEASLPAGTATQTTTANQPQVVICGWILPTGQSILLTNHIAPNANTAWLAMVYGGDY